MIPTTTINYTVKLGLRFIGMWPGSPYATVNWFVWMATVLIVQILQYWYVIRYIKYIDISELMDCLSVTLAYSLFLVKMMSLWLKRRIFHGIVKAMAVDWHNCTFNDLDLNLMTSKAILSHRCSNLIIGLNAVTVTLYAIDAFMHPTSKGLQEEDNLRSEQFVMKMEFPFDCSKSPIYEIIMITQYLHEVTTASLIALLNALIVTLVFHASGQIDIICREISEIPSKDKDLSMNEIRALIVKHQRIIAFSNDIENLFTHIALIEFVSNTFVICCLGFIIVTSIDTMSGMIVKTFLFYIAVILECFTFCFAGEYLSAKSKSIGDAAYKSLWYNLNTKECQNVLFLILRSQKQLTVTVGKIMDLSLEGFTNIIKASTSYVSVLHAMYS